LSRTRDRGSIDISDTSLIHTTAEIGATGTQSDLYSFSSLYARDMEHTYY